MGEINGVPYFRFTKAVVESRVSIFTCGMWTSGLGSPTTHASQLKLEIQHRIQYQRNASVIPRPVDAVGTRAGEDLVVTGAHEDGVVPTGRLNVTEERRGVAENEVVAVR